MKKIALCVMAACLSFTFYPLQSKAIVDPISTSIVDTKPAEAAEAKVLLTRLDQINKMDKSGLKLAEKRKLNKEVRVIKHRLGELGGGVYFSVGAIIIILLLLIILL